MKAELFSQKRNIQNTYFKSLDGLRALAVTFVVIFHCYPNAFPGGGRVGISLFFVLSGFLITSILINEWISESSIDFKNFYLKRIFRLVPAMLFLFLVVSLFGYLTKVGFKFYLENSLKSLLLLVPWGNLIFSKWIVNFPGIYVHFWTLTVEWKFYLIWPFLLSLLLKHFRSWKLWLILFLITFIMALGQMPILRRWLGSYGDDPLLKEVLGLLNLNLLLGAVLAFFWTHFGRVDNKPNYIIFLLKASGITLTTLLILMGKNALINNWLTDRFAYVVFSLCSMFVIWQLIAVSSGVLKTFLESRIVVFVGKISYGIYLYHIPVIVCLSLFFYVKRDHFFFLKVYFVTLIFSTLSYFLIEKPVLNFKKKLKLYVPSVPANLEHPKE